MSIKTNIIALFEAEKELTVKEIVERLDVTKQSVHLILNGLIQENKIQKIGRAPKTVYRIINADSIPIFEQISLSQEQQDFLNKEFLLITEIGEMKSGLDGFEIWAKNRQLPLKKTIEEFIKTKEKYNMHYDQFGLINGIEKIKNTSGIGNISLDKLYYLDFYAIERFGKTFLGTLLHYAKQGQNKFLMKKIVQYIESTILNLIQRMDIDAVGFVPPTIKREVQIMKYIQNRLKIPIPIMEIKKINGIIPVPQKSLNKLEERIRNAQQTFLITETRSFKKVLLIDDAVGSGATLNEIAAKIKLKKKGFEVVGLAITGSYKGFDVITDV